MPTNVTAQTAYGPMVLAAVEHNQPPARRLVDDDLAEPRLVPRRQHPAAGDAEALLGEGDDALERGTLRDVDV